MYRADRNKELSVNGGSSEAVPSQSLASRGEVQPSAGENEERTLDASLPNAETSPAGSSPPSPASRPSPALSVTAKPAHGTTAALTTSSSSTQEATTITAPSSSSSPSPEPGEASASGAGGINKYLPAQVIFHLVGSWGGFHPSPAESAVDPLREPPAQLQLVNIIRGSYISCLQTLPQRRSVVPVGNLYLLSESSGGANLPSRPSEPNPEDPLKISKQLWTRAEEPNPRSDQARRETLKQLADSANRLLPRTNSDSPKRTSRTHKETCTSSVKALEEQTCRADPLSQTLKIL
ncbi:putative protein TPRXL [Cyprinodon tularosa]|uniref:putative protein TPRXL n=1 Tax=Cyprinodon tularosa TaxID=77115 RepID=UPI0018E20477|nr:putative protein TPRXL [Cyprinodon tularosa]